MPDYETMYWELFRATTKAIECLQQAQIKTEELYISAEELVLPMKRSETHGEGRGQG